MAQHKRPGRKAKRERIARAKEREEQEARKRYREGVVVVLFKGRDKYDGYTGKRVALGIPPEEEIA